MSDSDPPLARLACSVCRQQKRKCTRELPTCDLCRRHQRRCEYPPDALAGLDGGGRQAAESELSRLPRSDSSTTLFFLDSYIFQVDRAECRSPPVELPQAFLELVQDRAQVLREVEFFFQTVHPLFPVVSKLRLRQDLSSPDYQADTTLLVLVIKLYCQRITQPFENADLLYSRAKRCNAYLEAAGFLSLRVLQAALLIAHYEVGAAIYPTAYLTVGACARLGHMMGLHSARDTLQIHPSNRSLVGHEEARRVWWGVVILDRYVNIGLDNRPFACRDAAPDDLLPMDEERWDSGEPAARPSLAVSAEATISAPPFARTCQAAHLLSRVLRHTNEKKPADYRQYYQEALQLHRVLVAFDGGIRQTLLETGEPHLLFPALAIALSALMSLYDTHTCADVDHPDGTGMTIQLEMQNVAIDGVKEVCAFVARFARLISSAISPEKACTISPLVANCLYQAAKYCSWYIRETAREDLVDMLRAMKAALEALGNTWALASEYLAILNRESLRPPAQRG